MIVKCHAEAFANQIADHGAGPETGSETRRLRPGLDERSQLGSLGRVDLGRIPRRLAGTQAVGAHRFEPLNPSIDRAARHIEFRRQRDDGLLREIRHHGLRSPPCRQVASLLCVPEQLPQPSQLRAIPSSAADCLPVLGATHDHPQRGRDRALLILSASFVNQGMDPAQRDPV